MKDYIARQQKWSHWQFYLPFSLSQMHGCETLLFFEGWGCLYVSTHMIFLIILLLKKKKTNKSRTSIMWHLFEVRSLVCSFQISVGVAKPGLGRRGVSFGCEKKCYEDRGQGDCKVFADSRGWTYSQLSEIITARVPIPPSTPVPASTDAVSYFLGCHVPAPDSLPPRLFALPDSAQQSFPLSSHTHTFY